MAAIRNCGENIGEKMPQQFFESCSAKHCKKQVNISPILLRLKDRENAENDRNFDRKSINFPLFEMEFLRNWFGNPAQGR